MAQFTNQAQLRYGNSVTNSNIAVGEILEVLSISKTAVKNTYHPGGTVTYIISIVNSGTTPITGLTLTDDLGAYDDKTTGTFATGSGKVTVPAATFTVNETTGEWSSNPGFSTLTITGTV